MKLRKEQIGMFFRMKEKMKIYDRLYDRLVELLESKRKLTEQLLRTTKEIDRILEAVSKSKGKCSN